MNISFPQTQYRAAFIAAVLAFVVYLPALQNGFVNWDDNGYVYENPHIRSLDAEVVKKAFAGFYMANWHPLTTLSYAVDYAFWGLKPAGYHLVNIVLHAINTFLVVLLVFNLLLSAEKQKLLHGNDVKGGLLSYHSKLGASLLTGLLFGVHPIHVESVAWISERKDVLYAVFFLLSMLSYIKYVEGKIHATPGRLNRHWYYSLFYFVLSLLSKPMAVTLPLVLLILDRYPLERLNSYADLKRAFLEKTPFFLFSAASAAVTIAAQASVSSPLSLADLPLLPRVLVAVHSLTAYVGNMLWPVRLVPFYPYPTSDVSLLSSRYFLPVVMTGAAFVLCLLAAKKVKVWFSAPAYYALTLLPVIGLFQVGSQAMADRYSYLPSIGLFLIISLGIASGIEWVARAEKRKNIFMAGVMGVLFLALSSFTIGQIRVWRDAQSLWNYVIDNIQAQERSHRTSYIVYNNRGNAYLQQRDFSRAAQDFSHAISLNPLAQELYANRATAYQEMGMHEAALQDLTHAASLRQESASASATLYNTKALFYKKLSLFDEALRHFTLAILLDTRNPDFYYNRGNAYVMLGRLEEAKHDYTTAISIRPHPDYYANRAIVHKKMGNHAAAVRDVASMDRLRDDQ